MKVFRMLGALASCGLLISSAYATPISPGETVVAAPLSFGGTLVAIVPSTITGPVVVGSTIASVYSDPLNTYCAGCLDFVYQFSNGGGLPVTGLFAATFEGFPVNAGFYAVPNGVAPTTISRELDGSGIVFNFSPALDDSQFSDILVVQTSALLYTFGSVTVEASGGTFGAGSQGFQPIPEPSPLALFSTGLLSLAGVIRMRFAGKQ
jgi:hypothetical protein